MRRGFRGRPTLLVLRVGKPFQRRTLRAIRENVGRIGHDQRVRGPTVLEKIHNPGLRHETAQEGERRFAITDGVLLCRIG